MKKSCVFILALTRGIILQSIIKIFQTVTEIQARNEMGTWLENKAEFSFLHVTLHIDLFYNATKKY